MTDRDEQVMQKLEAIGIGVGRAVKKIKAKELVMAEKYLLSVVKEVQNMMKEIRGE